MIKKLKWSIFSFFAFEIFNTLSTKKELLRKRAFFVQLVQFYSDRKINRFFISINVSNEELKEWVNSINLILEFLMSEEIKHKILYLLYHYRHLNDINLNDLFVTNFIIHKIRVEFNVKSAFNVHQKRWFIHIKWWLRKIISDDIAKKIYESIIFVNERLFLWNARSVIVDKVKNFTSENELRVTFDYNKVSEILSEAYIKLFSKVHSNLFNFRHRILLIADFKHMYLIIELHLKDRHYFIFIISSID